MTRVGTAPVPVVGLLLGPQLQSPDWALGLGLFGDLPGSVAAGPGRLTVSRAGAELWLCPRADALGLCATAATGAAWISGRGLYDARTATRLFAEVGLRAALRLGGGLNAGAQLGLPLLRLEVVDGVTGEVFWKTPPISAGLFVGVDLPL